MARALLRPRDELQLVTVVASEEAVAYGKRLLEQYEQEPCDNVVTPVVLVKGDLRLDEAIAQHVSSASADLLVMGSHNLCAAGTRDDPLPATGSFAKKLVKALQCCPVLVVKANSRGPYLRSDNGAMGLKVMVECQPHSRHMLAWLMDKMNPDTDGLFLAVLRARDSGTGQVKETATRMLNNFKVQASVNEFYTAQRVYKEAASQALPQAVEADAIDILAVQAPECKELPESITDLLSSTRSSILIYKIKAEPSAAAVAAAAGALGSASAALADAAAAAAAESLRQGVTFAV
ncbi:hypothetical protein OEZ85_009293 [Tetradesmus obliquus]|uniref:UspA domain-containing protein n=1 Tax=Tetradesmus obliquus TaxID=3088 RepID=A0ABY8U9B5_TETOB|nr:hypothetical protein OEZ85_009293 [Tetradesmus obliquus]